MKTKDRLRDALDRQDRFEAELRACDVATRAHLIGAWKETVMENLVKLFRVTDHAAAIALIDRNIAAAMEITEYRKQQ